MTRKLGASETSVISRSSSGIQYVKTIAKERTPREVNDLKKEYTTDAHRLTFIELEERYDTDIENGLTQKGADELLKIHGANTLVPPYTTSNLTIFLRYIFCGFAALLWLGAVLTFIGFFLSYTNNKATPFDQLYFGCILVIINLSTGIFGYMQAAENAAVMASFQKLTPKFATVIRDGMAKIIPSEEVVIGDLIDLKAGSFIPADIRLIESHSLKVDNSPITGESFPQTRTVESNGENPLETTNLVFYGTSVIEGDGKGIVILTGDNTLIGSIAGLASCLIKKKTLMHQEIDFFIMTITVIAVFLGVLFFVICTSVGYDVFYSFAYSIAIIVANVPEGLPVTLTACMTLTAKRMAQKNCLVKNVAAIETLGSCNVICSDKTGTLTQNRMTVSHLYYDNQMYCVLDDPGCIERDSFAFYALCRIGVLCNRATFLPNQEQVSINERQTIGDASESALLKAMEIIVGNVELAREHFPKICEIPFNSTNKYQISIHAIGTDTKRRFVLLMKGAPERILDRCKTILHDNRNIVLNDEIRRTIRKAVISLGVRGERVLAFADLALPIELYPHNYEFDADVMNFPIYDLRFIGLISLIDPPRSSVPEAVFKCRSAGIRVIMVTGDHPITAAAIARQVGIISPTSLTIYDLAVMKDVSLSKVSSKEKKACNAAVVTGNDLREMTDYELQTYLKTYPEIVFARTSPQQKLKIVEALQRMNQVVAVTGDGVNDSPAMKKADIGIAMGITGSDVSKEAADMILLDDNFSTIVTGIEEGRLIFDNLKKSIAYLLTSNFPEIAPFILMVLLNIPAALSVMAIIVIDIGTDLWPAISLAYEKPEADIMRRPPRDPKVDKLINRRVIAFTYFQIGILQTCAGFVTYYFIMAQHGFFYDSLIGIRSRWEARFDDALLDSYGQEWNFEQRRVLTQKCYTGYFLSIVLTQIADVLVCKTRRLSLFQQGMSNWVLNAGIFVEIVIAIVVVYVPGINSLMQFEPINPSSILFAVPFAIFIFVYDEIRKFLIRRNPDGWMFHETYY